MSWAASRQAGAVMASLRCRAEELCSRELERVLGGRESVDREIALAALHRAMGKLLHRPMVLAKEAAASGDGDLILALRKLFDLEDPQVDDSRRPS